MYADLAFSAQEKCNVALMYSNKALKYSVGIQVYLCVCVHVSQFGMKNMFSLTETLLPSESTCTTPHVTRSARTEGYYKIQQSQKNVT